MSKASFSSSLLCFTYSSSASTQEAEVPSSLAVTPSSSPAWQQLRNIAIASPAIGPSCCVVASVLASEGNINLITLLDPRESHEQNP
ncbi:hypothetical protein O6P43_002531 [Quillaja saponaria]|uniref:Uncharacterized protein n=1 Tax=Quillaja saponaria TaxID=32244 RepID=A0AAD7QDX8_QUISA|nr:hypothetical protein O6P43_002531 [Quillaja saponaria]